MNINKMTYSQPTTELFMVRFESAILTVSGEMGASSWSEGNSSWWEDDEE